MSKKNTDARNRIWNYRRGNFLKLVLDELNLNWVIKIIKLQRMLEDRGLYLKQGIRIRDINLKVFCTDLRMKLSK